MTNYRVFKFLAGCGIATLLLAGCGDDGQNLSAISTAPEAEAATASVIMIMNTDFGFGSGAPAFKSPHANLLLVKNHADRIKALKALKKTRALSPPAVGTPYPCEISGNYTFTAYSDTPYEEHSETIVYDECKYFEGSGTITENGKVTDGWSIDANNFYTDIYKAGNMDGNATASDHSWTYVDDVDNTLDYIELEDANNKDTWYQGSMGGYTDKAYSGFIRGQFKHTEGTALTFKMTANESWNGTDSYNETTQIYSDEYADSGNFKASIEKGTDTTAIAVSYNMTGTYEDHEAVSDEYELDSRAGTISVTYTSPDAADDCDAASGTYKIETIEAIKTLYGDEYPVSGELLVNNNTTVVFSGPGDVTISREGVTPADYDGSIDTLLADQAAVCSLLEGMDVPM